LLLTSKAFSNVASAAAMTERSRRAGASKANNAKSSVAELVALRKSGKKRADAFELKSEEDVYDMVRALSPLSLCAKGGCAVRGWVWLERAAADARGGDTHPIRTGE